MAWLIFLSVDEPEWIMKLIEVHPEFEGLYQEVYKLCRNTEVMMGLFSEELMELDKNTVEYMIDEMQNMIDEKKAELQEKDAELQEKDAKLQQKEATINEQKELIEFLKSQLAAREETVE